MTTGKDLLDLGFKSGRWLKQALEHINAHALTGDEMLAYLRETGPLPALPLRIEDTRCTRPQAELESVSGTSAP